MFKSYGMLYGPSFIILASILWALDGVVRRSLFTLPPITIVFYEHLIGALILLPFIVSKVTVERVSIKEFGLMGVVSLISGVLGTLWFTTALIKVNFISFSIVYLILYLEPIFAITTANLLLKEKVNKVFLFWAIIAIVAAYFSAFKWGIVDFTSGEPIIATLYAFGAAAAWGTSTTLSKIFLKNKSDVLATGLRFLLTSVFAFIGVLVLRETDSLYEPNIEQIGLFVFIALSTGMVALYLYYKGLQRTEAKVTTILELVFPILAVMIDALLYDNVLDLSQYVAAIIMLFAITQVVKTQNNLFTNINTIK